jgi:hypothetical protein
MPFPNDEDRYGPSPDRYGPSPESYFSGRGFLIGIGSALFIVGVWGIWHPGLTTLILYWPISGLAHLFPNAVVLVSRFIDVLTDLVFFAVSIACILAAKRASPSRSLLHAVIGWLLGFLVTAVIIFGLFMSTVIAM